MSDDRRHDAVIEIIGRARAAVLDVDVPARTRVDFVGSGTVETRREGVPPTGARPGETYRDVDVEVRIAAKPADHARGDDACGKAATD